MARIDRRISPNQTALWTVSELVIIQAARVAAAFSTTRRRPRIRSNRGWAVASAVLRWLVTVARSARSFASMGRDGDSAAT